VYIIECIAYLFSFELIIAHSCTCINISRGYFTSILDIFWGLFGDLNEGCTSENLNFFFSIIKMEKTVYIYFFHQTLVPRGNAD
jgi:hypothetical protein